MKVTFSLDEKMVKDVRAIVREHDTTLTQIVREYLQRVAIERRDAARRKREAAALEESFQKICFQISKKNWNREDLHERV